MDIYPTLSDLAGIPVPPRCKDASASASASCCTEGVSLGDVVRNPASGRAKTAAFYQWPVDGGNVMGYSIATVVDSSTLRYTEWVGYDKATHTGNWTSVHGVELYNHSADPGENFNLAGGTTIQVLQSHLSAKLHAVRGT